ncbi:MAG: hypothetical protein WD512_10540 [Candidatus Paceibacterota bacterium]
MNKKILSIEEKLKEIKRKYPLVPHTNAGRLYSTVRRMKAEKEADIPLEMRSSFAISTASGMAANEMAEEKWERFYKDLSSELKRDYSNLYEQIFNKK